MPDIGKLHPQVVHFVVASLFIGLPLYLLAFIPRLRVLRLTAIILLVIGVGASWAALESGDQAHRAVETIPGTRAAVDEHEEWADRTSTLFSILLGLQVLALLIGRVAEKRAAASVEIETDPYDPDALPPGHALRTAAKSLTLIVAVAWAGGLGVLYETAEHGGEIVYGHAGGVGTRSGDPEDVQHLLIAGLYNESVLDRQAGQFEDAARLVDEMMRRYPDDPQVRLLLAQSMIEDRKDGRGALRALASLQAQTAGPTSVRQALLRSDAYRLLELPDSARDVLSAIPERQRTNPEVARRLKQLDVR